MANAEAEQGLEDGHRSAAAIVAKDILVEIDRQVLVGDIAMGAVQPRLEVGDGPMRSGQVAGPRSSVHLL